MNKTAEIIRVLIEVMKQSGVDAAVEHAREVYGWDATPPPPRESLRSLLLRFPEWRHPMDAGQ